YHAIVFLEPLDRRNLAAIGYDMFTEPVRRAAMERARDTGQPAASRRVTLVQEIDPEKQVGFLIYVPVYAGPSVPSTVAARRASLIGYVYAPFRAADLFHGIFGFEEEPLVDFEVLEGDGTRPDALLHRSGAPAAGATPIFHARREFDVAGERWTLLFWSRPAAEGPFAWRLIAALMMGGVVFSLLLAWLDTLSARERRSARQVTEYRHAVRLGERLHQLAVDHVSDHAIFRVDPDGRIASWNRGVERVLGWPSASFVGLRYAGLLAPDEQDGPGPARAALEPPRDREMSSEERWCRRQDGTRVRCTVTTTSLADQQEQFAGWLVVMRDVTDRAVEEERRRQLLEAERTARREAERVGRMKDEFLATLSHELRTPLNAILGWAQVLARDTSNRDQVERGLEVIARNARAQAQIVEDLLDMSRIVSGKIRLEVEPVDAAAVVDAAMDAVRPMAAARGVTLHRETPASLPPLAADPHRLQQVLWNLLTNAVKFTPRGGGVRVGLSQAGGSVALRVADSGQGIAPEFLPHVFEPFRQADASATRSHGGLGLGLAIVKRVVELHGGSVSVTSEGRGRGACFTVTLPLSPTGTPGGVAPAAAVASGDAGQRLRGLSVLVVDDSPDGRDLARMTLEHAGARVEVAASAVAALELVGHSPSFDAVVSDIAMPGIDGHEFLRRLRRLTERGPRIPAVALTALVGEDHRERALAAGYDAYLTKPLDAARLVEVTAGLAGSTHEGALPARRSAGPA
nr:CHASE domain-containing protein [Vicinamibacterales bacterium]